MTAAVLAGGYGKRLQLAVADRPKVLAPVCGRPFLSYILSQLVDAGFYRVILCTGYLGGAVRDTFGDHYRGLVLQYSSETSPLGTGGAIRQALPYLNTQDILVMNGDSYLEVDLSSFWRRHCEWRGSVSMALTHVPDVSRFGCVEISDEGRILAFEEKNSNGCAPGWVNGGIYWMSHDTIERIPKGKPLSLEHHVFPSCIAKGMFGHKCFGHFLDIGTPESYRMADRFFSTPRAQAL